MKKGKSPGKWGHVLNKIGGSGGGSAGGSQKRINGQQQQQQVRRIPPAMSPPPKAAVSSKKRRCVEMNGHNPGMFVRVNNTEMISDESEEESDEAEQQPPPKRQRKVPDASASQQPAQPPEEPPKFNGPMYKIIRNGQVHRILVDPDRPGPSKEYEPLNALVRNQMTLTDDEEDEDFSEEVSDEELSSDDEENFEENYSDEVETGDSEHELDEELMRRMHHNMDDDSDEYDYDSDEMDSEFRSEFDTDDEEEYYRHFMHRNESSDTDYDPGDSYIEDVRIPKGSAKTYSVDLMSLPFSPDDNEPRVVDVTEYFEQVRAKSPVESQNGSQNGVSSDESGAASPAVLIESESSAEEMALEESSSDDEAAATGGICDDFKLFDVGKQRQILLLKQTIFINGVLDVQLLAGHAQINGYELRKNVKKRVVSAKGYKYTNITPSLAVPGGAQNGAIDDDSFDSFPLDLEAIRKEFNPHRHALLLLSRSKQTSALKVVRKFTERHLFPDSAVPKLFTEAQCKRPLVQSPQWRRVHAAAGERIMAIGGKNVGKTTFVENLVNTKLNRAGHKVLLIDLDIGQPILTVPQVVSAALVSQPILGLAIFDAADVEELKQILFGDISVALSPIRYLRCVKQLVDFCEEHFSDVPWIINTMGFQKGRQPIIFFFTTSLKFLFVYLAFKFHENDLNKFLKSSHKIT